VSQLFVIGLDSQVYTQKFDFNGTSTGIYTLSSPGQVKAMSVSADFPTYGLFVIGLDDQVYEQKMNVDGPASGGYFLTTAGGVHGWPGAPAAPAGPPTPPPGVRPRPWRQF